MQEGYKKTRCQSISSQVPVNLDLPGNWFESHFFLPWPQRGAVRFSSSRVTFWMTCIRRDHHEEPEHCAIFQNMTTAAYVTSASSSARASAHSLHPRRNPKHETRRLSTLQISGPYTATLYTQSNRHQLNHPRKGAGTTCTRLRQGHFLLQVASDVLGHCKGGD